MAAYNAVRPEDCRRVLTTTRKWGELWHLDRNQAPSAQRTSARPGRPRYTFTDSIYGPTALTTDEEPPMYPIIPLDSVDLSDQNPPRTLGAA